MEEEMQVPGSGLSVPLAGARNAVERPRQWIHLAAAWCLHWNGQRVNHCHDRICFAPKNKALAIENQHSNSRWIVNFGKRKIMKAIVVSGATKGIGRAIAERFASEGYHLGVCARNADDLAEMKEQVSAAHKVRVETVVTDMSKKSEVLDFGKAMEERFESIDVLVNNAGFYLPGMLSDEADGVLEQQINTNLYSAYHLTRCLIGKMKARREGHVFNICSTASVVPYTNGGSYCISKFAMLGFSKVLREEMKEYNVRVTSLLPGATYTNSWAGADIPEARFMKARDVANVVYNSYVLSQSTVIEEVIMRPMLGDLG